MRIDIVVTNIVNLWYLYQYYDFSIINTFCPIFYPYWNQSIWHIKDIIDTPTGMTHEVCLNDRYIMVKCLFVDTAEKENKHPE